LLATWDYWRKWADNAELAALRVEAAEQREQINRFKESLSGVDAEMARVRELERKVRIIANLPGASAVGGPDVTDYLPPDLDEDEGELAVPAGVPIDPTPRGAANESLEIPLSSLTPDEARARALTTEGARMIDALDRLAERMNGHAGTQVENLELLLEQLDDKRVKLASMPSIWPTKGWLTSRFGPRVSPFTGRRQMHAGLDIATSMGAPIMAPADGRVSYVGSKGPLGNTLTLDHGFGVKTVYGHTKTIDVKPGQSVQRGQVIASVGSTGRSTGPHLHYVIEVDGKPRNPLDYIFD
jgi:murein DD-endopeptidase MepM/ murein hydrolase activator NlpD